MGQLDPNPISCAWIILVQVCLVVIRRNMYSITSAIILLIFLNSRLVSCNSSNLQLHSTHFTPSLSELEVAVNLHAEALTSKSQTSLICETWVFPWTAEGVADSLPDLYTEFYSGIDPDMLSPTVLLFITGNETLQTNFSYHAEFKEVDLLYPSRFGFRRLSSNCVTLLIPLLNSGATGALDLTNILIVTKTGRPHKDYFVYIGAMNPVTQVLTDQSVGIADMRFKYGYIPAHAHTHATLINTCERKGEKLPLFSRKCDSHITGRHFKVSACFIAPLVSYENNPDGSRKWGTGMIFSMFEEASVQNNFTFEIRYAHYNGASGFKLNGKWYGAVGEVYSREADIACAVAPTEARNVIADASVMQIWMVRIFFVRQPAFSTSWESLFWSLDPLVWLAIFGITAVMVIPATYFSALVYLKSIGVKLKTGQDTLIIEVLEATYRIIMEQAATCRHWRGGLIRIMLMMFTFFCLVLRTSYSSKLIVFLSFLQQAHVPETHNELSLSHYKLFFRYYGGVAYNYMNTSKDPMHKRILSRASLINSSDECMIAALSTHHSACLDYRLSGEYATQQRLTINPHEENQLFVQSKDTDVKIHIIWSYRKGSPLTESFDKVLLRMLAGGLYEIWKRKNWHQARQEGAIWTKNHTRIRRQVEHLIADLSTGPKPLKNETLSGSYMLLFGGLIIALLAWVLEVLIFLCKYLSAHLELANASEFLSGHFWQGIWHVLSNWARIVHEGLIKQKNKFLGFSKSTGQIGSEVELEEAAARRELEMELK